MTHTNIGNAASVLRRYKWRDLTDPEKEAVSDAARIAATRAGVGLGLVLTTAAAFSNARRGKPPLPVSIRYGSLTFFSLMGIYVGFLSAGTISAKRILSVPNSKLAEDLRMVAGDWRARVPTTSHLEAIESHESLPDPHKPGRERSSDTVDSKKMVIPVEDAGQSHNPKTWTYWIGLTKS